jgi:hypothetical protein
MKSTKVAAGVRSSLKELRKFSSYLRVRYHLQLLRQTEWYMKHTYFFITISVIQFSETFSFSRHSLFLLTVYLFHHSYLSRDNPLKRLTNERDDSLVSISRNAVFLNLIVTDKLIMWKVLSRNLVNLRPRSLDI